ncbi:hypothetical protein PR002_g12088 [Phytophthora rubi]|uniref:Uncharacterized protein n=1 Tax=Phytophthora rubi TaxID=129364 RepID=A0A6A3LUW6_9STRA|nr:hypothetical protein PR002_g12088 [Phytophthora rubi]
MYEGKDVSEERPRLKSRAAKTASVGLAPINGSIVQEKTLILEALQLLFQCEYLVLVECVECLVPLVFAIYKSILRLLPNAIYYPVGVGNWGTSAVENTLIYAALEAASLLLLHYFLQRKFAFSPLYQLPFVLETQMYIIQACLFLEFVILLQFELAHLGVDFTFRFEWLRDNY